MTEPVLPREPALEDALTEREREILRLLADGATNAEIGHRLHLTEGTVKWYNRRIFDKLGARNRMDAVRVYRQLQREAPAQPGAPPPQRRRAARLPETVMIGREQELADVMELVRARRLVTLLGPGGIGKSTLSIAAARALQQDYEDGVWLAQLAGLDTSDGLPSAIAAAIGLTQGGAAASIDQMLLYLGDKHALLVLDNLDTLVEGAPFIQRMLDAAPRLHVLGTSRERLNLSSEALLRLGGLRLTGKGGDPDSAAIRLFLHHAQGVQPDLRADAPTVSAIARICQAVEGMPLAIVLAAGWVETLSLAAIATEITNNFDILSTELRDMPARHRSMRAVLDQTWARLGDEERRAYAGLGVFRGGFIREDAQAVTGATPNVLGALVRKSLLQRDGERYGMHELMRQYAEALLAASGNERAVRDAHAKCLLRRMEPAHYGPDLGQADFDNVRAAWAHASATSAYDLLVPAHLLHHCERLGRFTDAVSLCGIALARDPEPGLKAQLLFARGSANSVTGDLDAAATDLTAALSIVRQHGPMPLSEIDVLSRLGEAQRRAGRLHAAMETLDTVLPLARTAGDVQAEAAIQFNLGWARHYAGDYDAAATHHEQAYALAQEYGLTGLAAVQTAYGFATAHLNRGRLHEAKALFQRAHALAMGEGATHYACECLEMTGQCAWRLGELTEALDWLARSLTMAAEGNMFWMLAATQAVHGAVLTALGDYAQGHAEIMKGTHLARQLRFPRFAQMGAWLEAILHLDLDHPEAALTIVEADAALWREGDVGNYRPHVTMMRVLASARMADVSEAQLQAHAAELSAVASLMSKSFAQDVLDGQCELAVRCRDYAQAHRFAGQLLAYREDRAAALYGHQWQGITFLEAGAPAPALGALSQALALAEGTGYVARQIALHRGLQRAHAALGDAASAHAHAAAAERLVAQIAENLRDHPDLRSGLHTL